MYRTFLNPVELHQMIETVDRAFSTLMSQASQASNRETVYTLPVDVWQKDNACFVRAALPGLQADALDIRIEGDVLTLSGATVDETLNDKDAKIWRSEYPYGKFVRSIRLPEFALTDQVEANIENGVLTVMVPLGVQGPKSLKVEVKSSGATDQRVLEHKPVESKEVPSSTASKEKAASHN